MKCSKCWLAEKDHLECLDRDHAAATKWFDPEGDVPCVPIKAVIRLAKRIERVLDVLSEESTSSQPWKSWCQFHKGPCPSSNNGKLMSCWRCIAMKATGVTPKELGLEGR